MGKCGGESLMVKIIAISYTLAKQEDDLVADSKNSLWQFVAVCGLSLHPVSLESRKTLVQKFILQIGTLNPHGINEHFSFN